MLAAAGASFEARVAEVLGLDDNTPSGALDAALQLPEERRRELASQAVADFGEAAEAAVVGQQGDGVLFAAEVASALQEVREERLDSLEETVRALAAGHRPPPDTRESSSPGQHRRALLRYIVVERNALGDWGLLLGSVLVGLLLAIGVLKVSRWSNEDGDGRWMSFLRPFLDSLHGPLYILLATGGSVFGLQFIWLPPSFLEPVRIVFLALVAIGLFWMAWRFSEALPRRIGDWVTPRGITPGHQMLEVAQKATRLGLVVLFAFVGVEVILGADLTAVLAGLGIIGLAVTLAAQDTLKDLFAAVTLHTNRPFALGDLVRYAGHFGTIEEIGFRMTRLRTLAPWTDTSSRSPTRSSSASPSRTSAPDHTSVDGSTSTYRTTPPWSASRRPWRSCAK